MKTFKCRWKKESKEYVGTWNVDSRNDLEADIKKIGGELIEILEETEKLIKPSIKLPLGQINPRVSMEGERKSENHPHQENSQRFFNIRKCPYCAEEIQSEAIKCRFCGEMVSKAVQKVEKVNSNISATGVKLKCPRCSFEAEQNEFSNAYNNATCCCLAFLMILPAIIYFFFWVNKKICPKCGNLF